jgi:hypothetical protein
VNDVERYERMLKLFDWSFEHSDDGAYVRRARARLAALRELQQRFDPNGEVWLRHAPRNFPPILETKLREQQVVAHG